MKTPNQPVRGLDAGFRKLAPSAFLVGLMVSGAAARLAACFVLAAAGIAIVLFAPAANAQQGCGEWALVNAPTGALAIIGVEARSGDDAWAIGYFNPEPKDVIHWDGAAWSRLPTAAVCGGYDPISIEALDLVGPSHVLVSARASTGPFSSDQLLLIGDGTSWGSCHSLTLQPDIQGAPRNGAPNVIVAPAIDDAWILGRGTGLGDGSGEAYLTVHWDGSELTEEFTSGGPGNASKTFRDGVAFASNNIWAVGQYRIIGAGTPGYHASTYHFDGTSWNYVPNPAETLCCQSTDLNTVAGVAPNDVWAAGSWGIDPLFMHWDGSSWSIVPPPAGATGNIYEMVAIASDDVWAVDALNGTGIGKFYHWDGSAWSIVPGQEIPGAVGVERHGGLAAVGSCELWAVGSYNFGSNPVLPLIERLQGGTTAQVGTTYCSPAVPNSTGLPGVLTATGSDVASDQSLTLTASQMPAAGTFGLFFFGPDQIQVPFGDGFRCVGGMTQRIQPPVSADAGLETRQSIDFGAPYAAGMVSDADLNFQLWYRDPMAMLAGYNLTNGLNIVFQ